MRQRGALFQLSNPMLAIGLAGQRMGVLRPQHALPPLQSLLCHLCSLLVLAELSEPHAEIVHDFQRGRVVRP